MIDSSFITTLPDTWGINQKFILLAINQWDKEYQRVHLGGITCDSGDYYHLESNSNRVFLPKYNQDDPLYLAFFIPELTRKRLVAMVVFSIALFLHLNMF